MSSTEKTPNRAPDRSSIQQVAHPFVTHDRGGVGDIVIGENTRRGFWS